jgi:hypothetical protein
MAHMQIENHEESGSWHRNVSFRMELYVANSEDVAWKVKGNMTCDIKSRKYKQVQPLMIKGS